MENYRLLRWDLPEGTSFVSFTLPHPACTLSVEHCHCRSGVDDPVVGTGVVTRRFDVTARDRAWVLGVKFRPGGFASLIQGYDGSLADLAARYGWFEQAHFTREFTDLVGEPPSAYQDR